MSFAGEPEAAIPRLQEAFELLLKQLGEEHRYTLAVLDQLGATLYQAGQSVEAEESWTRALAVGERIYGPTHPEVGTFLNNLALARLEICRFSEAEPLLKRSVAIDRAARAEQFDDLTYTLNNIALVSMARGGAQEAESALREGLQIATVHRHRMLGPIGNNLADLMCMSGRAVEGQLLAAAAVSDNRAEYGSDQWRTRQAEVTRAFCGGETAAAADLDAALAVITKRWGERNVYRQRALAQMAGIARRAGDEARARSLETAVTPECRLMP